jgi:hypothetical protein
MLGIPLALGSAVLRLVGLRAAACDRMAYPAWAWVCGTIALGAIASA